MTLHQVHDRNGYTSMPLTLLYPLSTPPVCTAYTVKVFVIYIWFIATAKLYMLYL